MALLTLSYSLSMTLALNAATSSCLNPEGPDSVGVQEIRVDAINKITTIEFKTRFFSMCFSLPLKKGILLIKSKNANGLLKNYT